MKKLCSLLLSLLLLCSLLAALPVSAAGSLSASASASSVTVGNQVTVTLRYDGGGAPIAALDVDFSYNTQVFQYISCKGEGVGANGSAGLVSLSYYPTGARAPTSLTITLTAINLAAYLLLLPAQKEQHLDMYRLYKAKQNS